MTILNLKHSLQPLKYRINVIQTHEMHQPDAFGSLLIMTITRQTIATPAQRANRKHGLAVRRQLHQTKLTNPCKNLEFRLSSAPAASVINGQPNRHISNNY